MILRGMKGLGGWGGVLKDPQIPAICVDTMLVNANWDD